MAQGAHLNPPGLFLTPLGLFLRTFRPFIWFVMSAFLPAGAPWLRGPVSPRHQSDQFIRVPVSPTRSPICLPAPCQLAKRASCKTWADMVVWRTAGVMAEA